MYDSKSLQNFSLVDLKLISSTYIWTIRMSLSIYFINKVASTLPLTKSFEIRKVEILLYQALRDCFKPYKALSSLKAKSGCVGSTNPGVVQFTPTLQ